MIDQKNQPTRTERPKPVMFESNQSGVLIYQREIGYDQECVTSMFSVISSRFSLKEDEDGLYKGGFGSEKNVKLRFYWDSASNSICFGCDGALITQAEQLTEIEAFAGYIDQAITDFLRKVYNVFNGLDSDPVRAERSTEISVRDLFKYIENAYTFSWPIVASGVSPLAGNSERALNIPEGKQEIFLERIADRLNLEAVKGDNFRFFIDDIGNAKTIDALYKIVLQVNYPDDLVSKVDIPFSKEELDTAIIIEEMRMEMEKIQFEKIDAGVEKSIILKDLTREQVDILLQSLEEIPELQRPIDPVTKGDSELELTKSFTNGDVLQVIAQSNGKQRDDYRYGDEVENKGKIDNSLYDITLYAGYRAVIQEGPSAKIMKLAEQVKAVSLETMEIIKQM
jgi:hypothetical protein